MNIKKIIGYGLISIPFVVLTEFIIQIVGVRRFAIGFGSIALFFGLVYFGIVLVTSEKDGR